MTPSGNPPKTSPIRASLVLMARRWAVALDTTPRTLGGLGLLLLTGLEAGALLLSSRLEKMLSGSDWLTTPHLLSVVILTSVFSAAGLLTMGAIGSAHRRGQKAQLLRTLPASDFEVAGSLFASSMLLELVKLAIAVPVLARLVSLSSESTMLTSSGVVLAAEAYGIGLSAVLFGISDRVRAVLAPYSNIATLFATGVAWLAIVGLSILAMPRVLQADGLPSAWYWPLGWPQLSSSVAAVGVSMGPVIGTLIAAALLIALAYHLLLPMMLRPSEQGSANVGRVPLHISRRFPSLFCTFTRLARTPNVIANLTIGAVAVGGITYLATRNRQGAIDPEMAETIVLIAAYLGAYASVCARGLWRIVTPFEPELGLPRRSWAYQLVAATTIVNVAFSLIAAGATILLLDAPPTILATATCLGVYGSLLANGYAFRMAPNAELPSSVGLGSLYVMVGIYVGIWGAGFAMQGSTLLGRSAALAAIALVVGPASIWKLEQRNLRFAPTEASAPNEQLTGR